MSLHDIFIGVILCRARNIKTAALFANWLAPKKGEIFSLIYLFGLFCAYDIPHNYVIPRAMPPSDETLFQYQIFYCSTAWIPLLIHSMLYCSTIRCSSVPPYLFHCSTIRRSTVPPSLFHCCTIRWSNVPPSLFHSSTIGCSTVPPLDVLLFHHRMFNCFTIRCSTVLQSDPLFHHQMFDCSTIRCFTVPPSLFQCSTVLVLNHLCSTVPP